MPSIAREMYNFGYPCCCTVGLIILAKPSHTNIIMKGDEYAMAQQQSGSGDSKEQKRQTNANQAGANSDAAETRNKKLNGPNRPSV